MRRAAAALAVAILLAGAAGAQDFFPWNRGFRRAPPRFPDALSFDGSFNFCRLMYNSVRREAGGQGWWTDYPDADTNFSIRLAELTKTRVSRQPDGQPNYLVVRAIDPALFQCPFVIIEDAGTAGFTDEEVLRLREYLLKGGFMWVDDFWGTRAWMEWRDEIARVLPPSDYPIADLSIAHPLFRTMFEIREIPQIPSIAHWRRSDGGTSERGYDSDTVNLRGISDKHGRLMVLMTHNTDIADSWEREGEDPQFFYSFSPNGYAVGINVMMYAMTH
ncbi:MAG TPA: DUF4159 domain-containing protein [Vicinamibacterales bacterium]|nr:DUF4159 domain-containing protein [Vicinamibacterales bacterium]